MSSRLAQCSITRPSAMRNQWLWVMAKVRPVGGKARSTYRLLVVDRGWSLTAYETWLAETLITSLLPVKPQG
jgi:hypothetical protein